MFYDVAIICLILNDNRAKKKEDNFPLYLCQHRRYLKFSLHPYNLFYPQCTAMLAAL